VVITLDVGPRIISYRTTGGENAFQNFDAQLGGTGEAEWQARGRTPLLAGAGGSGAELPAG